MSLGRGNKIFSSLDLLSGYWQVPMAPASREVTAFGTTSGHYEWLRMPFGLKAVPFTLQQMRALVFCFPSAETITGLKPGALISYLGQVALLEDVLMLRYPFVIFVSS